MVTADLMDQPDPGFAQFSNPRDIMAARRGPALPGSDLINAAYLRPFRGPLGDVYAAARNQTEAQRRAGIGLVVPGSANDPGRIVRG